MAGGDQSRRLGGAKASLASAAAPKTSSRFAALMLDGLFCWLLLSAITGGGPELRVKKTPSKSSVSIDVKGLRVEGDGAVVLYDDKKGLRVTESKDRRERSGRDWGFALVWFVYNLVFLKKLGTTPGKRLLKLKVVALDGGPLDNRQRMTRAGVSLLSGYAAGLGYLWALWEPQRRGWHDLMADTRVVAAD